MEGRFNCLNSLYVAIWAFEKVLEKWVQRYEIKAGVDIR
jgi:hypothetical protein